MGLYLRQILIETLTCVDGVIETILSLENKYEVTVIGEEVKTSDGDCASTVGN